MKYVTKHLLALTFAGLALTYSANSESAVPSTDGMSAKALKIHNRLLSGIPLYDDPELHEYANELAAKIGAVSKNPNLTYRVYILDSDGVNAFTPGYGLVYFYRGLISLLTTEGQLAAVIAHEIGHNVGDHLGRSSRKRTLGNIGEVLASIFVGNSGVGNAIGLANQESEMSFGRELELEADAYAAEYLFATGYDPKEMIGALSILKDFSLLMDQIQGTNMAQYHGVFDNHPSNDIRLRELVEQAGQLPPGEEFRGRAEMRQMLDGMVFGPNFTGNKRADQERYLNKSLGITFVYPNDWTRSLKGSKIVLANAEKTLQLQITIEKTKDKTLTSEQILRAKYPDELTGVEKHNPEATKDLGTLGRVKQKRVAAVTVGRNTFHFLGISRDQKLSAEEDALLVEIIKSFRRATREDLSKEEVKRITIKRLEPGETFSTLAKTRTLGKYTEGYLRVMNGYFPKGEAEPGTYLKVIEDEEQVEEKQ